MPVHEAGAVLDELARTAAGRALVELAQRHPGVWLVGGAVRDILLGRRPRELDVVIEGDALAVGRELAAATGGTVSEHPAFGTASVTAPGLGRIDLAGARTESYAEPGALPQVTASTLQEDLARRDFTVNAIAVAVAGPAAGELHSVAHALDDLTEGRLRVLHDASFLDDPTRLLRLGRYCARLSFDPDAHTRLLAARAVRAAALQRVSGARVGAELRLCLAEPAPLDVLAELERLDLLSALHPRLRLERHTAAAALELLPGDGRRDLLLLTALSIALVVGVEPLEGAELRRWLDRLEFPAAARDRVVAASCAVPGLLDDLAAAAQPSQLRAAVGSAPPEAVALAGALGPRQAARRWLEELRHVRLQISGDDLLEAGVPAGPEIGRRLSAALDLRLDGALGTGRTVQLRAALNA